MNDQVESVLITSGMRFAAANRQWELERLMGRGVADATDMLEAQALRAARYFESFAGRGTAAGLVWLVEVCERTTVAAYRTRYPYRVEGRIVDAGEDRGSFAWHIASIADPAYVLAPGVVDAVKVTS